MKLRRVIAGFDAGACRPETLAALAALAAESRAELLALFIEDSALIELARLPFATEVGWPSATRRTLDPERLERELRARAETLRRSLAAALEPAAVPWAFRIERGRPADALAAALAEGHAPALLIPPRARPRDERRVVHRSDPGDTLLRELAAGRPVLVLPEQL
jgi:hypothetical protein